MKEHESLKQQQNDTSCHPAFEQGGVESCPDLCGFMSLLIKINEREQIVPTKQKEQFDADQ